MASIYENQWCWVDSKPNSISAADLVLDWQHQPCIQISYIILLGTLKKCLVQIKFFWDFNNAPPEIIYHILSYSISPFQIYLGALSHLRRFSSYLLPRLTLFAHHRYSWKRNLTNQYLISIQPLIMECLSVGVIRQDLEWPL